jgi:DNA-binding transcriptional MerR regulator
VFEPPPFRGPGTRYAQAHLDRLLAVQALRRQGLRLAAIKARLDAPPPAPPAPAPRATPLAGAEHWSRLVLLPGLELFVRADAGEVLERLAAEIRDRYGVVPSGS